MRQDVDPGKLLTKAVIDELKRHYNGLEVVLLDRSISLSGVPDDIIAKANLDLQFYFMNPELPLENLCSNLNNYKPGTDSQTELVCCAKRLLDLSRTATAGLFIWGDVGVGKTHMAVALSKEFLVRGQDAYFISAEDYYKLPASLGPQQVWILDDLNSPYSLYMDTFKKIVLNAHNKGGRVFVTSNTPYDELMDNAFTTDPQEKRRYMDRTKHLFRVIHIIGSSRRDDALWYK